MTLMRVREERMVTPRTQKYEVCNAIDTYEFLGVLLADVSRVPHIKSTKSRWTDMYLYRVDASESSIYRYMLQIYGRSTRYHVTGNRCIEGGQARTVQEILDTPVSNKGVKLYDVLIPCPDCGPKDLDELEANATVCVEEDFPSLYKCIDAKAVVEALRDRDRDGNVSMPGTNLLRKAARVDADIQATLGAPRSL